VVCDEKEYYVQAVRSNHVVPSLAYAFVEKSRPGKFYPEKAEASGVPKGPFWSELQCGKSVKLSNGRVIMPEEVMGKARTGRKVVYSGDTRPFGRFVRFAAGADVLIHDATLGDELAGRAKEDGHSTPTQAAETAKKAKVKKLVLTHISARYDNAEILLKQAKKLFKNTVAAEDFMKLEIPLSDN
jgi:ribonuclease Z